MSKFSSKTCLSASIANSPDEEKYWRRFLVYQNSYWAFLVLRESWNELLADHVEVWLLLLPETLRYSSTQNVQVLFVLSYRFRPWIWILYILNSNWEFNVFITVQNGGQVDKTRETPVRELLLDLMQMIWVFIWSKGLVSFSSNDLYYSYLPCLIILFIKFLLHDIDI